MGTTGSKLEGKIDEKMEKFFFRVIPHEYIVTHIEDFIQDYIEKKTNYYDFQCLIKVIGIHDDLSFQNDFWEKCYVWHTDKYGLDGILLIPLFLCQGEKDLKLEYVKEYMSKYIKHEKEFNRKNLIINLTQFYNIMYTYFSCIASVPLNYLEGKLKESKKQKEEKIKKMNEFKLIYSNETVTQFTNYLIKGYSRKNFYVNAGKFFEDRIESLTDDKKIREEIKEFYKKGETKSMKKKEEEKLEEDEDEEDFPQEPLKEE